MEDDKLVKRCQVGDKEAFQELISKYHPFVYKFLIKITANEDVAEDITQETFLKLIRNIEKFDVHGKAKFSTYIITISKNCYIDYLRKEKKFSQDLAIDENINAEDINTNTESIVLEKIYSKEVKKELENLSEEQKLAIKMKYIEGLTLKEIGEKLELEPKTVKSRIHNGIVKLRKIFEGGDKL
ncbi:RNA polymerase sigma factor [Clostridium magnum]|uniref:ECF RNA polymerase sigma factor SigW n=1 Tax=Clostridium magnum DSM 2767 TaxID=1121326 RepID=A0A162SQE8_9CLOT|nr:sigma-70 family RNA polymerase sigma factor [Clostridium magnum]KZL91733.1 ECF RNA polymerase sigma factor SigW [Clostridium magnum DSM 2767]SHJ03862.1 RNA polymerase sigma-70 factor, ECF subfamily [Clostridium magnum DSM 2767]